MKTKAELNHQIVMAYAELERIKQVYYPGSGKWREQKRYIDALEWVLDEEPSGVDSEYLSSNKNEVKKDG